MNEDICTDREKGIGKEYTKMFLFEISGCVREREREREREKKSEAKYVCERERERVKE